jgi:hypothetical protein
VNAILLTLPAAFLSLALLAPPHGGGGFAGVQRVSDPGIGESTSSNNADINDPSGSFSQSDLNQKQELETQQIQANDLQHQATQQQQNAAQNQLNQMHYDQQEQLQPQSNPQKQLFQPPQFGDQPQTPGPQY